MSSCFDSDSNELEGNPHGPVRLKKTPPARQWSTQCYTTEKPRNPYGARTQCSLKNILLCLSALLDVLAQEEGYSQYVSTSLCVTSSTSGGMVFLMCDSIV